LVFAIAQPNLHFLNRQVLDFMVMFSGNQSIVESWQRLLNTGDD
jgi:hypothetical protein